MRLKRKALLMIFVRAWSITVCRTFQYLERILHKLKATGNPRAPRRFGRNSKPILNRLWITTIPVWKPPSIMTTTFEFQQVLSDIGEALEARFVLEDKLILLVLDAARVKHPACSALLTRNLAFNAPFAGLISCRSAELAETVYSGSAEPDRANTCEVEQELICYRIAPAAIVSCFIRRLTSHVLTFWNEPCLQQTGPAANNAPGPNILSTPRRHRLSQLKTAFISLAHTPACVPMREIQLSPTLIGQQRTAAVRRKRSDSGLRHLRPVRRSADCH